LVFKLIIRNRPFSIVKEVKYFYFLITNKVSFFILFKLLKWRVFEIFYLNNFEEKKFIKFVDIKKLKYSKNWFLANLDVFSNFLKIKPKNILEIGTYEGLTGIWMCENFLKSNVYCVDPLVQDLSTSKERIEKDQVDNLYFNLRRYKNKKINFFNGTSDAFFLKNQIKFDIIYIDGLHTFEACTKDMLNSFQNLNLNGYLLVDDLRCDNYPIKLNIINAVINFINNYNNYIEITFIGWSVIIMKKISEPKY
jgi:hypothetical protein